MPVPHCLAGLVNEALLGVDSKDLLGFQGA